MNIAITMTATRRPTILRQTLSSFFHYLFQNHSNTHYDLFLNVDPGGDDVTSMEIVNQAIHTLPHVAVTYNCPTTASFPKAFKWTWESALQSNADLFFHLEDDWRLNYHVNLGEINRIFTTYPDLAILRLSAFPAGAFKLKIWNKWTTYNGDFFEIADGDRGLLGFAGHPSFIRREFVELAVKALDGIRNPEKQLKGHNKYLKDYMNTHRFGVYNGRCYARMITDLGRPWMIKNGWRKSGSKAMFTNWEEM